MCTTTAAVDPIIDLRQNGIGDVVVACWVVHSALAAGKRVGLNPGRHQPVAEVLGVPEACVTRVSDVDWTSTPGIGHQLEYELARVGDGRPRPSRFAAWCQSLGLPGLVAVRPPYREAPDDAAWAEAAWRQIDFEGRRPRVLIFPEAAWSVRVWPRAYFIDVAAALDADGMAVAAMASSPAAVDFMPCHWWGGFRLDRVAAVAARADLVIANDSGCAHLSSTIGTPTVAVCGPTDPSVVFGHDPNVTGVHLPHATMACAACHFDRGRGYRHACDAGGCQALMRLEPGIVVETVKRSLAVRAARRGCDAVGGGTDHHGAGRRPDQAAR